MRSEAFSIVPHFSQANFNKRTKSMPFFLRQIAATLNAFKSDFEARLTYDVIELEKVKAVFLHSFVHCEIERVTFLAT